MNVRMPVLLGFVAALVQTLAACGDDVRRPGDAAIDGALTDAGDDGRVACPALACPENQFCETTSCTSSGSCRVKPMTCPLSFSPVCGCNRITYQNDCYRRNAGIALANIGPCNDH